jgi:predicted patatin/cPLA2 family phospholipase
MKCGVVDAGGGFRGIYGTGVLDACLENGIYFDYCIGSSAGSANLASYLSQQKGRNRKFYGEYGFRKEYCSFGNWLRKGSYLDLDYVYGTLINSDGEDPMDYDALVANPAEYYAVSCNALTGETLYFDKSHLSRDHYDILKASCALPGVCRPVQIGDLTCFDGGIADPVPFLKAFADGCDKVVVILTKPRDTVRLQKDDAFAARLIRKKYPKAYEQLMLRYQKYNDSVALAKEYEKQGKVLIVAPDNTCGMTTLKRTPESLDAMYQKAQQDAQAIPAFLGR